MLNTYPEMVISNELDALYLFKLELSRTTIFSQIMKQEQRFAKRGYQWTGYDYTVPGQYQGRFERLPVIGDKKAGLSTRRLETKPELLDMVRCKSGVPIRVVHVVRNPFDNIATMARRQNQKLVEVDDLGPQIEGYGTIGTANDDIRARLNPDELIDIRYESFLHSPGPTLVELCNSGGRRISRLRRSVCIGRRQRLPGVRSGSVVGRGTACRGRTHRSPSYPCRVRLRALREAARLLCASLPAPVPDVRESPSGRPPSRRWVQWWCARVAVDL